MGDQPYERNGSWWFNDGVDEFGPYITQVRAEKDIKRYCYYLDHGPTKWQKFWWPIRNTPGRIKRWFAQWFIKRRENSISDR